MEQVHIDLHLHTTASDGKHLPEEVVKRAAEAGIKVISLTDHDTIAGYERVKDSVKGTTLIPGAEVTTLHDGVEIHILAYFPNGVSDSIRRLLENLQEERVNRMKLCLLNLRKRGLRVEYRDVYEFVDGRSVSRSHIARALVAQGFASNVYEAFSKFLSKEAGLIPPPSLSTLRLFEILAREDAISIWAHPEPQEFDRYFRVFKERGLRGVEICSKNRFSLYFEKTAVSNGLLITFGSDWHGFSEEERMGVRVALSKIEPFFTAFGMDIA